MVEKSGILSENDDIVSASGGKKHYLWYLLPAWMASAR